MKQVISAFYSLLDWFFTIGALIVIIFIGIFTVREIVRLFRRNDDENMHN